jgi:hypothetical protein
MAKFNFKKAAMRTVGIAAGTVAAKAVNVPLKNLNPKLRAGGKVAAGLFLPAFAKSSFVQDMGDGMVAVGVQELMAEFVPALAGIGDVVAGDVVAGDADYQDNDYSQMGALEADFTPISGGDDMYAPRVYGSEEEEVSGVPTA